MDIKRKENEKFLKYADRIIQNKDLWDLDNSEIYELFFEEQVSSDHARKSIHAIRKLFEKQKIEDLGLCLDGDGSAEEDSILEEELIKNYKSSIEMKSDGSQTSDKLLIMSEEDAKNPEFLMKAHGYCTKSWFLTGSRNNIWNVYSKRDGVQTLYSSSVTVKPLGEYSWNPDDVKKMFDEMDMSGWPESKQLKITRSGNNGRMLVIPIADLHYNLLSEGNVAGNDYNIDIAVESFFDTLEDIVTRTKHMDFEKILFVVGNDFINADNLSGTTTRGTPQDNQRIWYNAVSGATDLIKNGIDYLGDSFNRPIDVLYVPSNHDLHTMYGVMQTLKAWYRNDKNVKVDGSPMYRKYYRFGKSLLVFSHDMKPRDGLEIISTEAKEQWSDCTSVDCFLAHLHTAMVYEEKGYLKIRRLPTISGWSRWTNTQGYVQSEKKNQSFIVDKDKGITDIINTIL